VALSPSVGSLGLNGITNTSALPSRSLTKNSDLPSGENAGAASMNALRVNGFAASPCSRSIA
jgi:hypothetical protein